MPVNFDGHLGGSKGIFGGRMILVPFDKRECMSLKEAAAIASKSVSAMRGRCEEHGLGRRVGGGTWSVSKVALAMHLDGNVKALRAYHAGNWKDPDVIAYFKRAGLGHVLAGRVDDKTKCLEGSE